MNGKQAEGADNQRLQTLLEAFYTVCGMPIQLLNLEECVLLAFPREKATGLCSLKVPVTVQQETVGFLAVNFDDEAIAQERGQAVSLLLQAMADHIGRQKILTLHRKSVAELLEEYVDNHLNEELSVTRLCQALKVSRPVLYNLTRQHVGGGIAAYVLHQRMERAQHLLRDGLLSAKEIAAAVGFSDYSYFLRVYKKTYGVSPVKLQRAYEKHGYREKKRLF